MSRDFKVCVCGGAGGIGQPLAGLLAMDPLVAELSIQDIAAGMPAKGVAADVSHLETPCKVRGYEIDSKAPGGVLPQFKDCLGGCHLVIIAAGMPRKPGMTRDDLFNVNAKIAANILEACAVYCPIAVICFITNPVNSVVPAMCEIYKSKGLNPAKICGVTTLDGVRANKFVGEMLNVNPEKISVPVIGGHAGQTILPVFSQDLYSAQVPAASVPALDQRVQNGGTEVVNAKQGRGSATLSTAFASARLCHSILLGLSGKPQTVCAYVPCSIPGLPEYFTTNVTYGLEGVHAVHAVGKLNEYETQRLEAVVKQLKEEIATGVAFAKSWTSSKL